MNTISLNTIQNPVINLNIVQHYHYEPLSGHIDHHHNIILTSEDFYVNDKEKKGLLKKHVTN